MLDHHTSNKKITCLLEPQKSYLWKPKNNGILQRHLVDSSIHSNNDVIERKIQVGNSVLSFANRQEPKPQLSIHQE